jgi:hypothetical protein
VSNLTIRRNKNCTQKEQAMKRVLLEVTEGSKTQL